MEVKERKYVHHRPLFYCFLALILSMNATRFIFNLNIEYLVLISVLIIGLFGFLLFYKQYLLLLLFFAVLLLGCGWYFLGVKTFEGNGYVGVQQIEAHVSDNIEEKRDYTEYLLKDVKINGKNEKNIYLRIYEENTILSCGDQISFQGEILYNSLFNLGNFNLSAYRDSAPYVVEISDENIEVLDNHLKFDESFRLKTKNLIYEAMGVENGSVAYAVLFGDTVDIGETTYDAYKDAGILHLIAVSGLNVTFLITLIGFILKIFKVKRFTNFLVCFFVLMIYTYLCGFAPSILRAGIMGIIFLATKLSGKCYDGLNSLGLAGIISIMFSPLSALDNGFLMSYFSVLGILFLNPVLSRLLSKVFPKVVAESFSVSISAQLAILPFLASYYTVFNFLSFFINLIVVPLFAVIYPVLFVSVLICFCLPFMDFLLALCGWGLELIVIIANFFAGTSLTVNLKPFNVLLSAIAMLSIFAVSNYVMVSWKGKGVLTLSLGTLFLLSALVFAYIPTTQTSILYSINNQNNLVIFTNSSHKSLIVDGGYYSFINNGLNSIGAYEIAGHMSLSSELKQNDVELFGKANYLSHQKLSSTSGSLVCEYDKTYEVGDFKVKYVTFEENLIGLEVCFDNYRNFVLYKNLTEEQAEFLNEFNYDFIISLENYENLNIFDTETTIGYYGLVNDYSYQYDGNLYFILQDNNYFLRGID